MTPLVPATVLFGDVVDSRADPGASAFLRALRDELEAVYGSRRLAPAGFTQGDELQLLLVPGADPFLAVLRAALHPDARELRWAVVAGGVQPGTGPATERTGPAFIAARELLERAKTRREGLVAQTGDAAADALLLDLGPVLAALLAELTDRQREVARLLLVEGLRRAEAAERLGVSRATVSVIAARGRVRHLAALAAALARTFGEGVERASRAAAAAPAPAGAA
jgi:DNA-binding CsgD family transcriptional regulator